MSGSVFDLKGLCDRVAGRVDLVAELIQMLLAQYPLDRERLVDLLHADDAAGAREVAHRVKGQLQTLGVNRAAEQARQIECLARDGRVELALAAVCDLDREIRRFEETVAAPGTGE
jgi:HPt (histidine-containing phosphotransfer) domain-containing protein